MYNFLYFLIYANYVISFACEKYLKIYQHKMRMKLKWKMLIKNASCSLKYVAVSIYGFRDFGTLIRFLIL